MRLVLAAALVLLITSSATSMPASLSGIIDGLTQGPSGAATVGDKCRKDEECMNSLMCFHKRPNHHGRCAYAVAYQGQACKIEGDHISSHNRCAPGLACRAEKCELDRSYGTAGQGLGEPCFNPIIQGKGDDKAVALPTDSSPKVGLAGIALAGSMLASAAGVQAYNVYRPAQGIPCKPKLACKVDPERPNTLGRCFPPKGKKYVE